jgi:hypothetical protein
MEGDRTIEVTLKLSPLRAVKFVSTMRRAADLCTTKDDMVFWRNVANVVADQCVGEILTTRYYVARPEDDDEVALQRVLRGEAPIPVLSRMDSRRVVAKLGHKRSARQLGDLLYMNHRTVSRWRAEHARGEWKKYGIE